MSSIDLEARYTRVLAADVRRVGEENSRRISVAVSSEEPVSRLFGDEILSHERSAIDLSFFGSGRAPLLLDHDSKQQIGVVESVSLDESAKVLRAVVRFSKSPFASEVLDDVLDGIRMNTSIQYRIHEHTKLPNDAGYRITKWTPLEASIVSIPADPTVGVGRSIAKGNRMTTETNTDAEHSAADAVAECYTLAGRHNMRDEADRWLTPERRRLPANAILAGFRAHMLSRLEGEPRVPTSASGSWEREQVAAHRRAPALHLGGEPTFDLGRAVRSVVLDRLDGLEAETSQELARRVGKPPAGFYMPPDALAPVAARSALLSSGGGAGLHGVDHMAGGFIEALKAKTAVMAAGATVLQIQQDTDIPGGGGTQTAWVGEDEAPTDSAPTFNKLQLRYHQLSTSTPYSRKMLVQAEPFVGGVLRMDMLREIAVQVDKTALVGSGTPPEPKGIIGTAGVGVVSMVGPGNSISWPKVCEFIELVESENVTGHFGFITNHKVKSRMMTVQRGVDTEKFILDDANVDKLAGYPIHYTGNMPSNFDSTHSGMIFGAWEHLIIAQIGPLDVIVDTYSLSSKGGVRVSAHSAWDVGIRYPGAFAYSTNIFA